MDEEEAAVGVEVGDIEDTLQLVRTVRYFNVGIGAPLHPLSGFADCP